MKQVFLVIATSLGVALLASEQQRPKSDITPFFELRHIGIHDKPIATIFISSDANAIPSQKKLNTAEAEDSIVFKMVSNIHVVDPSCFNVLSGILEKTCNESKVLKGDNPSEFGTFRITKWGERGARIIYQSTVPRKTSTDMFSHVSQVMKQHKCGALFQEEVTEISARLERGW